MHDDERRRQEQCQERCQGTCRHTYHATLSGGPLDGLVVIVHAVRDEIHHPYTGTVRQMWAALPAAEVVNVETACDLSVFADRLASGGGLPVQAGERVAVYARRSGPTMPAAFTPEAGGTYHGIATLAYRFVEDMTAEEYRRRHGEVLA